MAITIGVDIDGVLANFTTSFAKIITEETGIVFPVDSPDFPSEWYWDRAAGVNKEQETRCWNRVRNSSTFWKDLAPWPQAHEFLSWLVTRQQDDIYFITHRMGHHAKYQTERWLKKHGFLATPTVLMTSKKGAICVALGVNFYVDDKLENCTDVMALSPTTNTYMLARPYNKQLESIPRGDLAGFRRLIEESV